MSPTNELLKKGRRKDIGGDVDRLYFTNYWITMVKMIIHFLFSFDLILLEKKLFDDQL